MARVQPLGRGDHLVDLTPSPQTRRACPDPSATLRVRAIRYQRRGFRAQTSLTSLLRKRPRRRPPRLSDLH